MRQKLVPVLAVGAAGGVGGALNATHALVLLGQKYEFAWHLVPAGFAHGALLAAVAFLAASLAHPLPLPGRLLGVPLAGWIAGFVAWGPLSASTGLRFLPEPPGQLLLMPFFEMGLVASLAYAGWAVAGRLRSTRLFLHLAVGVSAGILGSATFWLAWENAAAWKSFPLHGAVWGLWVGLATYRFRTSPKATT
ncbi:MAG TPA: hypothetical protein VFG59_09330 [Anaeromyxobacter sp.]|nr:hypothetical protein [Anaeromyxobacter sp.]